MSFPSKRTDPNASLQMSPDLITKHREAIWCVDCSFAYGECCPKVFCVRPLLVFSSMKTDIIEPITQPAAKKAKTTK